MMPAGWIGLLCWAGVLRGARGAHQHRPHPTPDAVDVRFIPPQTLAVMRPGCGPSPTDPPSTDEHMKHQANRVMVVVNSRHHANCSLSTAFKCGCRVTLPVDVAGGGVAALSVAVYAWSTGTVSKTPSGLHSAPHSAPLRLLSLHKGDSLVDSASTHSHRHPFTDAEIVPAVAIVGRPRILLYNTVENVRAAQATQATAASGKPITTIEDLVESQGNLTCASMNGTCGNYHATPVLNGVPSFYCWWRQRAGSDASDIPCPWMPNPASPCPNISANALVLANMWHATGIDVVVPDTTNLDQWDQPCADELNIRPVEVLAEELAVLRDAGVATPSLAVWTVASKNTTMYHGMLGVMNSPSFARLQLREPVGDKAVFFVHSPDSDVVAAIEANSGSNNVSVITMWANIGPDDASNGTWTFFQPCQRTSEPLDFTTTVLNDDYYMCNHLKSADKPGGGGIGTQMSAAMSWQGSETSFAWASPSKLMGLTFQAMVDDALRERPENIMLPSFDEWGSPPRPISETYWAAQGTVGFPPEDHVVFLDTFGAERSRSWAPTIEAGDFYLRLTQSCLRVIALAASSGATTCDVQGELCCDRTVQQFTRVFSLQSSNVSKPDYFVTNDAEEAKRVQQLGLFTEICASSLGPYSTDYFCYAPGSIDFEARMGPFILYSLPDAPPTTSASLLHLGPRLALYRCTDQHGHFMSTTPDCDGSGPPESVLGYVSVRAHTGMPRFLRQCRRPGGVKYHTLDAYCLPGDTSTTLGHVM